MNRIRLIFFAALSLISVVALCISFGVRAGTEPNSARLTSQPTPYPTPLDLPAYTGPIEFDCGSTRLRQTDALLGEEQEVYEGSSYAVITKIENIGSSPIRLSTNFLFRDPNEVIIDGSSGANQYYLQPGQSYATQWHHTFGCHARTPGYYALGIGTAESTTSPVVSCGYTYHQVELEPETICPGFEP